MKWIHRLFNPHCPHCIQEDDREINFLRQQIKDLQNYILHPSVPIEPIVNTDDLKPLQSSRKPFSIIRNELEQADRLKAKQLDEQILANAAAKADVSPIVNDEGKVDPKLVEKELEAMNQEIKQHG